MPEEPFIRYRVGDPPIPGHQPCLIEITVVKITKEGSWRLLTGELLPARKQRWFFFSPEAALRSYRGKNRQVIEEMEERLQRNKDHATWAEALLKQIEAGE